MGDEAEDHSFDDLPGVLADFPRRWNAEARPKLRALEKERIAAIRILVAWGLAGAGAALVFLVLRSGDGVGVFEGFFGVIIVIAGLVFGLFPMSKLTIKVKKVMIEAVVAATGLSFQRRQFVPDRWDDVQRLGLTRSYNRAKWEDRLSGVHAGAPFILYEAHLEIERQDNNGSTTYDTVFQGIIGILDFPSSALGVTVLARDGKFFDSFSGPKGLKRAGLEDPLFEKKFTAWTSDQVEARYFLNPQVMQSLLDLETRFHGKRLRCGFLPGEMIFAIETGNWFEPGSPFKPLDDPKRAHSLVRELAAVFDLIETLADCAPRKDLRGRNNGAA